MKSPTTLTTTKWIVFGYTKGGFVVQDIIGIFDDRTSAEECVREYQADKSIASVYSTFRINDILWSINI